jgi:NADH-quinone oxidoreductase subunit J
MGSTIAFWILAVVIVLAAIGVLASKNLFRAALSLIVCLIGVAGIFALLNADFLAGAQILIYVGAISVIIILAIMLTQNFSTGNSTNRLFIPAIAAAIVFFVVLTYSITKTNWNVSVVSPVTPTTPALAQSLFSLNGYILPLEITAVLLLAVIIGAIVIAREK